MPNQTKTPASTVPKPTSKSAPQTNQHNPVRTMLAALLGILAVVLILSSLVSVWLNRTLTDTNTYVSTVAPLATKPAIQNFISQKISDELIKNAPTVDLANALLPAAQVAGQPPEQLKVLLAPVITNKVLTAVAAPSFAELWKNGNQTAHSQLITQLNSNSTTLSLDLNSVITGVTNQLKTTELSQFSNEINVPPEAGKIDLKGSGIDQARTSYHRFKQSTIIIVIVTLVAFVLSVIVSTHHIKTTRRILVGTGVISLILAGLIQLPSVISIKGADLATQKAVAVMVQTIFHSLQVAALTLGLSCIAVAAATKVYQVIRAKS